MALLSDDGVRERLEYLSELHAFCEDIGLADHINVFYNHIHDVQLRKKFHEVWPTDGRGNFVATGTLALFAAPDFLDSVAHFSRKKMDSSGSVIH